MEMDFRLHLLRVKATAMLPRSRIDRFSRIFARRCLVRVKETDRRFAVPVFDRQENSTARDLAVAAALPEMASPGCRSLIAASAADRFFRLAALVVVAAAAAAVVAAVAFAGPADFAVSSAATVVTASEWAKAVVPSCVLVHRSC